ncbi:F-box protein CPR1-like [Cornus florida]|uniref:F-box protein CPR1-like n=1 Tax=Cornus florida TaxID=4283 RepID=UPI002899560B|nr:F-box protein CPR1-like [Cornus florida]
MANILEDLIVDILSRLPVVTLLRFRKTLWGSEITVFSLKSNVWRRINHRFSNLPRPCRHGVFFNGALHWVATRQPESHVDNYIAAFDLGVENFREVQLPEDFWTVTLGVSGGCLWLFGINVDDDDHLELWVMNNYMMREMSWTKHSLSFFSHVYEDLHVCQLRILGYSKGTTQVLLVQLNFNFFWLDLKQQTVADLGFRSRGFRPLAAEIYIASLVKVPCDQGTNIL